MKNFISICYIILFFCSCGKVDSYDVKYSISPVQEDSISMLKIRMSFKPNANGITKLHYQDKAWGEDDIYNCIHSMQLLNEKGVVIKNPDSNWVQIKHAKNLASIEFDYILKQDINGGLELENSYRPIINKDYFHVFSHNLFMLPSDLISNPEDKLNIQIDWNDFPEDVVIHNSFGSKERSQLIRNISNKEFHEGIFVGGDFRINTNKVEGNDVVLAIRGDWVTLKDTTLVNLLSNTVKLQRDFWSDHSQEYFTVTMQPITIDDVSNFGGTGLTNSFAIIMSNNEYTDIKDLCYLFNHELMHNWIGSIIMNENEEEQYWFSEGFTEYYTFKNITRHQILGNDESYFIEKLNTTIKKLYTSPVGSEPNSTINYENFWSNRFYEKLPYHRGSLFAFILDMKIQKESNGSYSLDTVMLDFFKMAQKSEQKINREIFISTVNKYLTEDIRPFFDAHIIRGEFHDLTKIFDTYGFQYDNTASVFDLGFQYDEKENKILSVDSTSVAYKTGLRVTDKIRSRSIYFGSIDKQVKLTVIKDGKEVPIHYFPVKNMKIQQLKSHHNNKNKIREYMK